MGTLRRPRLSSVRPEPSGGARGQALVETALLIPILLILLLGAIDFGRLFFGWVNLHQAARIGANFASTHPNTATDEDDQDDLVQLILGDAAALNCDADIDDDHELDYDDLALAFTTPGGAPTGEPTLGDYATLDMECDFSLLIPLSGVLFGDPINMRASSTFPVREGCINCPDPAPVPPPPTPEQCRLVPEILGMSVAGARLAWTSAGFDVANFTPQSGEDTSTVIEPISVTEDDASSTCELPQAIFSSSVVVTVAEADATGPGCATLPNLVGLTVGDARTAWAADFDAGLFFPDIDDDSRRVISQSTTGASSPGVSCMPPSTSVDLISGEPWPAPPPPTCRVPSMIEAKRAEGEADWVMAGFSVGNFSPTTGNFTIRSQSLVGGTQQWVPCSASISVSANP